jgi:hypothetical protein
MHKTILPKGGDTVYAHNVLTKKFLLSVPEGKYLASNCFSGPNMKSGSIFEGIVPAEAERLEFWKKIKAAGADQRLCVVYDSKEEYDASINQLRSQYVQNP